jgi:outer membrane protein TolC
MSEQQARVALAHALQKPDVAVGGGATFNAQPDFSTGWRFNIGFTVPLFTSHRAGVLVEDATLVRLHAERDATVDEIAGGVAAALPQATSAATRLTNFNDAVLPLSLQDETFAQDAYRSGGTSLAELILSLEHAHDRRLGALQAALDFHLALADLERAIAGPLK